MQLPRELAPWSSLLDLFPCDLALSLGSLVRRLNTVVGRPSSGHLTGREEPDGYAGLASRGPYERLLMSEWLLADEIPHEFDRRAVMSEHLFLKRHHASPKAGRVSVALFDCGPGQLGAPRLIHLALLILLARRAEAAGATFYWGVLQHPEAGMVDAATPPLIQQLLTTRSFYQPGEKIARQWAERVRELGEETEVWVVSDAELQEWLQGTRVVVRDSDEPQVRAVVVEVHTGARRRMELELPPESHCVRLLRNPFRPVRPVKVEQGEGVIRPECGAVFSRNGRKIAVRLTDGDIAVSPIPNSPSAIPGRMRRFRLPQEETLLALEVQKKRLMVVTTDSDALYVRTVQAAPDAESASRTQFIARFEGARSLLHLPPEGHLIPCWAGQKSTGIKRLFFCDGRQHLVELLWDAKGERRRISVDEAPVQSFWVVGDVLLQAAVHEEMLRVTVSGKEHETSTVYKREVGVSSDVFWVRLPEQGPLFFAYEHARCRFSARELIHPDPCDSDTCRVRAEISVAGEEHVLGIAVGMQRTLFSDAEGSAEHNDTTCILRPTFDDFRLVLALVILSRDRTSLILRSQKQETIVGSRLDPVIHAVYDPSQQQAALFTSRGELIVYSIIKRTALLRAGESK